MYSVVTISVMYALLVCNVTCFMSTIQRTSPHRTAPQRNATHRNAILYNTMVCSACLENNAIDKNIELAMV